MPNNNNTLTQLFTDIASAIRAKKGTNALIAPSNFATEIAGINNSLPIISMVSWENATNITTSDYMCIMWETIRSGANGFINTTNATIYYSYYDDIYYEREDPYIKVVNKNTQEETVYWKNDVNSSYIKVPFNFGDYQNATTDHTNMGSTDLDAAMMLFRVS